MSAYSERLRREKRTDLASRIITFATKTEDGEQFTASDYAYVPDSDAPSTWKLRLTSTPGGTPDPRIVGAAVAALGKGFRGNKVQIPVDDLPAVKAKVKAAWKKAYPDKSEDDIPSVIASGNTISLDDSGLTFAKSEEVPWQGPITFEDEVSGDNRLFESGSVYWDANVLPFPFRWVEEEQGGNKAATHIGRIDNIWRDGNSIQATGVIFSEFPQAKKYLKLMELNAAGGVSIDADSPKYYEVRTDRHNNQIRETILNNSDEPDQHVIQRFTQIRIRGLTAVDVPAFINARITLLNHENRSPEMENSSKPVEAGNRWYSDKDTEATGNRWYSSHSPVKEGNRWYASSWWAGEPPRNAGNRWYSDEMPVQEGNRWYASSEPKKQEANWRPATEVGNRWYSNENEVEFGNRWYDSESEAGNRWYGNRWYTNDAPMKEENGNRWYGNRWYVDDQPIQAGNRWYSATPPVREGNRWYVVAEPVQEGSHWYDVSESGNRWYEDESGNRWYDAEEKASVNGAEEFNNLPSALKDQIAKKLKIQSTNEKDPKKKAAIESKIAKLKG